MSYRFTDDAFGFTWGPMQIQRCASTPKWGVMFDVVTPLEKIEIHITPSGSIRTTKVVCSRLTPGVKLYVAPVEIHPVFALGVVATTIGLPIMPEGFITETGFLPSR